VGDKNRQILIMMFVYEKSIDHTFPKASRNLKTESRMRAFIENEASAGVKTKENMPENNIDRYDI